MIKWVKGTTRKSDMVQEQGGGGGGGGAPATPATQKKSN